MIFVVLGTQKFAFDRLLKTMDILSEQLQENVFAQIGHSKYIPQNFKYAKFLNKEEFEQNIRKCSLLITHGGVGTIMSGFNYNKPIIVVPRQKMFEEHVDDHQLQISNAFGKKNYVIECMEMSHLLECIEEAKKHQFDTYQSHHATVIHVIEEYLNSL